MLRVTKGDKILVVILILLSIVLYILIGSTTANAGAEYISVQVDGEEIERIKLGDIDETNHLEIETIYGDIMIGYDSDSSWIIESDCQDKLCIKQGEIIKAGQVIVCLPLRVIVEIIGEEITDVDIINY